MPSENEIREIVRRKYGAIAGAPENEGCCFSSCCSASAEPADPGATSIRESYDRQPGYVPEADLGLGCGVPTEFAGVREGDTVLDLGSGAGNDAFVARAIVGEGGRVIGVDMTPEMISRARRNNAKLGHDNVEFRLGEIENLPVAAESVDVVISNCVLNLVPDKKRAFAEIHRVMKASARFCISDIVIEGNLPVSLRKDAELLTGCVAGAARRDEYLRTIEEAGFRDVKIVASKVIEIPKTLNGKELDAAAIRSFRESGGSILSVTVVGRK
jgi:SAM-dependent methyltransferase